MFPFLSSVKFSAKENPSSSSSSLFTPSDLHLFSQGTRDRMYEKLGAHLMQRNGQNGYSFAVWAPNAQSVSVTGSFNGWDDTASPMHRVGSSGIWETFISNLVPNELYKYALVDCNGRRRLKADPYARFGEHDKGHASILCAPLSQYVWHDGDRMAKRAEQNCYEQPLSIYEIHAGSWKRDADGKPLSYRELAHALITYLKQTGFTHVEFMPIAEHPLTASWGYQVTGFFAPTSRYGTPQDFQYLVDTLHQNNIGVILDWVPGHFPKDDWGLARFDGTALYEHLDPRLGEQPDWGTYIFNFGRNEVRNFLINSALFWADAYHVDGLRFDAVSAMLYLNFSRKDGEWIPNRYGGKENLEAVDFLRTVNDRLHQRFPGFITVAEESSSFGRVSQPTAVEGLGFDFKWNMGWMHDTLSYLKHDPLARRYHHNQMTFGMLYQYSEHFVNAFSHDEVVYGKCSLLRNMGSHYTADKFATLRALYGFMWGWPGKKLLFMGDEFAPWDEWDFHKQCDWFLLQRPEHAGVKRLISDLNALYRSHPVWYQSDMELGGFFWINPDDAENSVFSFIRKDHRQRTEADKLSEALQASQPFQPDECLRDVCRALGENNNALTTDAFSYENSDATGTMNEGEAKNGTLIVGGSETVVFPSASMNDAQNPIRTADTCGAHMSDCGNADLVRTATDAQNGCTTSAGNNNCFDKPSDAEPLLFISNFTPVERSHYKCGVPLGGAWREIFNSDASIYGGENRGNCGGTTALSESHDRQPYMLNLCLPPLSTLIFEHVPENR